MSDPSQASCSHAPAPGSHPLPLTKAEAEILRSAVQRILDAAEPVAPTERPIDSPTPPSQGPTFPTR